MRALRLSWLAWVLSALLLLSDIPCGAASAPDVSAEAYVLMDADSGRVLLSRNETSEKPIASTTKIMTALVALEHCALSDSATVRREHLREGSSMYLREGETLTMEALLYGLMLPSGNDAAECIADCCGGSGGTERFVGWMNEKAAALGMTHTAYANPSGLDAAGHYSCALDLARLMAYAMDEPAFARIVSSVTATAGTRTMGNHNKLLGVFSGCIGGKTGYTGGAGRTLVTCAERGGMRLIAVTLHDGNDWQDHTALYEYGFNAYRRDCAVRRGERCALCAVRGGEASCVELCAERAFSYPLAQGESLSTHIACVEAANAPVREGDVLGWAVFLLDGAEVGRVALTTVRRIDAVSCAEQEHPAGGLRALLRGDMGE
ncbi:MAG: D-alanyl-D-alanine carboxypeptidase [Ruminococcaceae bacterium]|nr:D-alanyl-D-alanine carboxypeptidase [Oscillospiraceae bacterium]